MRLNKATTHAIRTLATCARTDGELIKVSEIAERLDLSQQNAFKIVHLLSRAGFLKAMRGRYGGVMLSKPAAEIRIGDVVTAMEALTFERAEAADGHAGSGSDGLHVIDDAFAAFVAVLNLTTIADMAADDRKPTKSTKPPKRSAGKPASKPASKPAKDAKSRGGRRSLPGS